MLVYCKNLVLLEIVKIRCLILKTVYKMIFQRKHDYDTLYDLVRLGNVYNEFASEYIKKTNNPDYIAIAKNGKLTVLAILIYLAKKERKS